MQFQSREKMEMLIGFLGVIIGAFLQFIYAYRAEKRLLKNDYKKLCVAEWLLLITQVSELVNEPNDFNHIIFNQYIDQKAEFIRYVAKCKKVEKLISDINNFKDDLSLGEYAEKALNIESATNEDKTRLMRDVTVMVNKVIKEIYKL